jgi:signal transduction histidine kinase
MRHALRPPSEPKLSEADASAVERQTGNTLAAPRAAGASGALLSLDPAALDRLYPSHVRVDSDFRIVGIGRVIARLLPGCARRPRLDEIFDIERPRGARNFRMLAEARDQMLLMHSLGRPDLKLKGEVFPELDGRHLTLLTVPWIVNPRVLDRLDLRVSDFALGDATPDLMFMVETQAGLLEDAKAQAERLRNARDEAVAANRAKSDFLANMSHELRTPLNAIIGFSDYLMVLGGSQLSEKFRSYVADIHKSGRLLLDIVNDLLDLARIEAGRLTVEDEEFDLTGLVRDIAGSMKGIAQERAVSIEISGPRDGMAVRADPRLIRQILLNLLSNAIKFNREGGRVDVDIRRQPDGGIVIAVIDTGIGIDPENIPELFQPFRQANSRIARTYGGTGLGLSIVRQLACLHQGDIAMTSEPGRGTTVSVRLPPARVLGAEDNRSAG